MTLIEREKSGGNAEFNEEGRGCLVRESQQSLKVLLVWTLLSATRNKMVIDEGACNVMTFLAKDKS